MTAPAAIAEWLTAAEIAAAGLPGLPTTARKVTLFAAEQRWSSRTDGCGLPLARRGDRGAVEYHASLLPPEARTVLARDPANDTGYPTTAGAWAWFERQTDAVRDEAARRMRVLAEIERACAAGAGTTAAISAAAATWGVSVSTIKSWRAAVRGVAAGDRLPLLAPDRRGGGAEADVDAVIWQALRSDYLRPERPTFESCYRRASDLAAERGIAIPCSKTLFRRLRREVKRDVQVRTREGLEAFRRLAPPQQRTVAHLHAMELVNIDGHRWDVFVQFPGGEIARPMMIAIQDFHSRKILAWRIGATESAVQTRLAFADLFARYGIPKGCVLDNGRAFASKWITGGAKTRFRFKIREDDATGLLPALGVNPHWALPYRGSSKPIERAFRDMCSDIAKHPAFAGAYTGNKPDAKPENYRSRAIPLDAFARTVDAEIDRHNARRGRRTETARGQDSFDEVFARSYAVAPIGKASAEQLRLALLTAENVRADRIYGSIKLYGNRYHASELGDVAGQSVIVRFDPDDLSLPLHVYSRDGSYIASAPMIEATGVLDVTAAKTRARQERERRAAVKRLVELQGLIEADDLARLYGTPANADPAPEPSVIRPVRHRGQTAAALKPDPHLVAARAADEALDDRFAAAIERRLRIVD